VELEKLKVAEASYKAFKNLDRRIGGYLKNLNTRFGHVEVNVDADVGTGVGTEDAVAAT
jgi:hypothetical protein